MSLCQQLFPIPTPPLWTTSQLSPFWKAFHILLCNQNFDILKSLLHRKYFLVMLLNKLLWRTADVHQDIWRIAQLQLCVVVFYSNTEISPLDPITITLYCNHEMQLKFHNFQKSFFLRFFRGFEKQGYTTNPKMINWQLIETVVNWQLIRVHVDG